jgi:hypothetical protein
MQASLEVGCSTLKEELDLCGDRVAELVRVLPEKMSAPPTAYHPDLRTQGPLRILLTFAQFPLPFAKWRILPGPGILPSF